MGRRLGAHLPSNIELVTVESQNIYDFSEELSPSVFAAVSQAAQRTLELINNQTVLSESLKTQPQRNPDLADIAP